ncbi:MAG: hypothetical protein WCA35_25265, partial [Kovacikia sp.]
MQLIICAGIHNAQLTQSFLQQVPEHPIGTQATLCKPLIFPTEQSPPYSGIHLLGFVHQQLRAEHGEQFLQIPLVFIGFSAGVVGAIAAAWGWQLLGGRVQGFIAIDGWG